MIILEEETKALQGEAGVGVTGGAELPQMPPALDAVAGPVDAWVTPRGAVNDTADATPLDGHAPRTERILRDYMEGPGRESRREASAWDIDVEALTPPWLALTLIGTWS